MSYHDIERTIQENLRQIERSHSVKILYACESGSRAWGFASQDSDYDVRFIYVHPLPWYLSVEPGRDVIELPSDAVYDIGGWDLRKALRLLWRSNCALIEWLASPIVYREDTVGTGPLNELVDRTFLPETAVHHYLAMAERYAEALHDAEEARLKTYCYALRTTLCCRYIIDQGRPPPMKIGGLMDAVLPNPRLRELIDGLIEAKAVALEKETVQRIPELEHFLAAEQQWIAANIPKNPARVRKEQLDAVFREILRGAWGIHF